MPGIKINCISKVLMWSGMRKYQEKGVWEYRCLICKICTDSDKTQGGSSNHWGYLVTTTAQLRVCVLNYSITDLPPQKGPN